MNGISGIKTNEFDWGGLVEKLNAAAPGSGVQEATFDANTNSVNFTVGEGDSARTITVSVPELQSPGTIDQNELEAFVAKLSGTEVFNLSDQELKQLLDGLPKLNPADIPNATKGALFDLYQLMVLMLEVAQKQRDAAREIRGAENQAIQTAIQCQADTQRSAALTGLICAIAVCSVQLALTAGISASKTKAQTEQNKVMEEYGSDTKHATAKDLGAKSEFENTKLDNLKNVKDAQDANALATNELDTAKTNYQAKANSLADAQENTANAKQAVADADPADPEAVATAKKNLTDAQKAEADAQAAHDVALSEYENASNKSTIAKENLDIANNKYKSEVNNEQPPKDVTPDDIINQQAKASDAQKAYNEAKSDAEFSDHALSSDSRFREAGHKVDKLQNEQQTLTMIGQIAQSVVRSITDTQMAGATEMGAEQKEAEENMDQIRDLFNNCQEVINKVIQLSQAIIQAENQSMNDAIRA